MNERDELLKRYVHWGVLEVVIADLNETKAQLEHTSFKVAKDWDAFTAAKGGVNIIEKIVARLSNICVEMRQEAEEKEKKKQEDKNA